MSAFVRTMKNVTKGYSHVQVAVRNATSNDPWGPSGTDMSEIASLTFNNPSDFYEIMDMLDKRLNDKGKNWRHVLKALKVLDYCLHEGSELVVTWARKNIYIIKTLREFQYVDESGHDVGQNVRTSAKELTSLILDEDRLRSERSDRKLWKTRVTGIDENPPPNVVAERQRRPLNRADSDDAEMKLALEASRVEAEEDERRRRQQKMQQGDVDDDLAKALKLSKEEEDLRRRELEDQNAASLFDDGPLPSQAQPTGYNQGYQQQPAVDWFGNPLQQQPQQTGYLNNQYAVQPQQTAYPMGYPQNNMMNGYQQPPQPQQTGFDQFGQAPQPQFMQPQQPMQTQPSFQSNDMFGGQPPQSPQAAGSNNPWSAQSPQPQHQPQQESLKPLPTGSNNPFAPKGQQQQRQTQPSPFRQTQPSLGTLYESQPSQSFQQPMQYQQPTQPNPIMNFQAPPQQQQPPLNPHHAKLDSLLASGGGQDTFGNVGDTRIPAQHTTPGMFVNSAGVGMDRLKQQQTSNNPYLTQSYTGMQYQPQQPSYGGGYGSQPNRQQNGSLIDL